MNLSKKTFLGLLVVGLLRTSVCEAGDNHFVQFELTGNKGGRLSDIIVTTGSQGFKRYGKNKGYAYIECQKIGKATKRTFGGKSFFEGVVVHNSVTNATLDLTIEFHSVTSANDEVASLPKDSCTTIMPKLVTYSETLTGLQPTEVPVSLHLGNGYILTYTYKPSDVI